MTIADDVARAFADAGARGFLHARDVDGSREVALDADSPVVTASVFKIAVMVELACQAATGDLSLTDRLRVPASRRTVGPTGVSVMLDEVDLSVRDLAYLMMSVSDNTATDLLMERIGTERIAARVESLGLRDTSIVDDCAAILNDLASDLGVDLREPSVSTSVAAMDPAVLSKARALRPETTNRTTARDMTALLSLVWRNEAGPADACAEVRRIMALQVWPHRLSSGFGDGVKVAAKTGTLPGIRNEAGVVTYPDGRQYAVAVFTKAHTYAYQQPSIDSAIGTAARIAVESLRKEPA